jgi:hypothetical protein
VAMDWESNYGNLEIVKFYMKMAINVRVNMGTWKLLNIWLVLVQKISRYTIDVANVNGHLEVVRFLSSFDTRYTNRGLYINQNGYYKNGYYNKFL